MDGAQHPLLSRCIAEWLIFSLTNSIVMNTISYSQDYVFIIGDDDNGI